SIGDLLLLPKRFNASYGDMPYSEKVNFYNRENILARTLSALQYQHNPGFISFMNSSRLPVKPYDLFEKKHIHERAELYKQILLWNWKR
ncbi:DUF1524 domain-containing protein, partial [bacterium]|nr:DUF1524 domain-containing protein [bacterium]